MFNEEIIKSVFDIYYKFKIPWNLQQHMVSVAAVGSLLCEKLADVDTNEVVACLLIHDLGNLIKMDLDNGNFEHLRELQKTIIQRYGTEATDATIAMAKELEVPTRLSYLISHMGFQQTGYILQSGDLSLKVCFYADGRVGPNGILSIGERARDGYNRYKHKKIDALSQKIEAFIEGASVIEKYLMRITGLKAEDVTDESIRPYMVQKNDQDFAKLDRG